MRRSAESRLLDEIRGSIRDPRVLQALTAVSRAGFVPPSQRAEAYENRPLPIGCGQTISQPLVVGRMLDLLHVQPTDRVLDVGTGSGWHAALLAELGSHVWTIERYRELADQAGENLAAHGVGNVTVLVGDGCRGYPAAAPYDAINVAAASHQLPEALVDQLAVGGRLVAPVGGKGQHLMFVRRTAAGVERHTLEPVRFVPLVSGLAAG